MAEIDDRFLSQAGVFLSSTRERDTVIEDMDRVLAVVSQVLKKGRRAKLPRDWSYDARTRELTINVLYAAEIRKLIKLAMRRGLTRVLQVRDHEHSGYQLVISL